jgi:hypothetical protein
LTATLPSAVQGDAMIQSPEFRDGGPGACWWFSRARFGSPMTRSRRLRNRGKAAWGIARKPCAIQ